jgi:hypothetical protein
MNIILYTCLYINRIIAAMSNRTSIVRPLVHRRYTNLFYKGYSRCWWSKVPRLGLGYVRNTTFLCQETVFETQSAESGISSWRKAKSRNFEASVPTIGHTLEDCIGAKYQEPVYWRSIWHGKETSAIISFIYSHVYKFIFIVRACVKWGGQSLKKMSKYFSKLEKSHPSKILT